MCGSWPEPPGNMVLEAMDPTCISSPIIFREIESKVGCWISFSKTLPLLIKFHTRACKSARAASPP
jgi:hypothetical protein